MDKINLTCPHCSGKFDVRLSVTTQNRPRSTGRHVELYDSDGHVYVPAKKAVAAMLRRTVPGNYKFTDLYDVYQESWVPDGAPSLGKNNFAKVLTMLGCEPYRTKNYRGYTVPEPDDLKAPPPWQPQQVEEFESTSLQPLIAQIDTDVAALAAVTPPFGGAILDSEAQEA